MVYQAGWLEGMWRWGLRGWRDGAIGGGSVLQQPHLTSLSELTAPADLPGCFQRDA